MGAHLEREDGRRQNHGGQKRAREIVRFFVALAGA